LQDKLKTIGKRPGVTNIPYITGIELTGRCIGVGLAQKINNKLDGRLAGKNG